MITSKKNLTKVKSSPSPQSLELSEQNYCQTKISQSNDFRKSRFSLRYTSKDLEEKVKESFVELFYPQDERLEKFSCRKGDKILSSIVEDSNRSQTH